MNEYQDRAEKERRSLIPSRLLKGARILGQLWRNGVRCATGTSWGECSCQAPNDFCGAKKRWLGLMKEYGGRLPFGVKESDPYAVIESMTASMFEATGLTALVRGPADKEPIRIGKNGTVWKTLVDLAPACTPEDTSAWDDVLKIQKFMRSADAS